MFAGKVFGHINFIVDIVDFVWESFLIRNWLGSCSSESCSIFDRYGFHSDVKYISRV